MEYLLGLAVTLWSQGHVQGALMAVGVVLGLQTVPALRRRAKGKENAVVRDFPVKVARALAEDRLREDLESLRRIQMRVEETARLVASMVETAHETPSHQRMIELLDEHEEAS